MKRLFAFLIAASLCLPTASFAWWKSIQQVGAGGVLPGPPAFTFKSAIGAATGGTNPTWAASAAGTPGSTRFVAAFFWVSNPNGETPSAPVFNASGAPVTPTLTRIGVTAGGNKLEQYIAYAVVPADVSGGGITFGLTFTGSGASSQGNIYYYTAVSTQFASLTPVTGYNQATSGTSITTQVNVLSGGAVIAYFDAFGVSTQGLGSPNDPGVVQDDTFGGTFIASKNNSTAFSPANINATWTGSFAEGGLGLVTWR